MICLKRKADPARDYFLIQQQRCGVSIFTKSQSEPEGSAGKKSLHIINYERNGIL